MIPRNTDELLAKLQSRIEALEERIELIEKAIQKQKSSKAGKDKK